MKTHGIFICEKNFLDDYIFIREHFNVSTIEQENVLSINEQQLETISEESGKKFSFTDKNGNGHIYIDGPLSDNGPDFFDRIMGYGGTSYDDIISAIDSLEEQGIKKTYIHYNTPGGEVGKVDLVWNKIKNSNMKIISVADGMIASGGYYLASAGDEIISNSPGFEIGSIGVIVSTYSLKEYFEKNGIKAITIRSENASRKVPDIDTEEGQAEYLERINATERLFYKRISEGRGISESKAKKTYGNGAVFPSQDVDRDKPSALNIGMIDKVINGFKTREKGQEKMATPKNEEEIVITESNDSVEKNVVDEKTVDEKIVENDSSFAEKICKSEAYPQPIKNLAIDVMVGKASNDALKASVAAYDSTVAAKNVSVATEDDNKEIKTQNRNESKYNGEVKTIEDWNRAKAILKGVK